MNHRTAKDRLLENLPPEQRPYFDRCLHRLSPNPDDPLIALFSILTESDSTKTAAINARLDDFEQQQKQREAQIARSQVDNLKAMRQEYRVHTGETRWHRVFTSRIVGAVISTVMIYCMTKHVVDTKVRTVDPAYHAKIEGVESKLVKRIDDQAKIQNERMSQIMETNETLKKTYVTSVRETLLGKGLSYYVESIDEKSITLLFGGRRTTLQHNLTPDQYLQLSIATRVLNPDEVRRLNQK